MPKKQKTNKEKINNVAASAEKVADDVEKAVDMHNQLFDAVARSNIADIDELLLHRANVNWKDEAGHTPLFMAVQTSDQKIVRHLVAKGAEVNAKDEQGAIPLHYAVISQTPSFDLIRFLIESGSDLDAKDKSGQTCRQALSPESPRSVCNLSQGEKQALLSFENKEAK